MAGPGRASYDARTREIAGEMYVHRGMNLADIADALDIPLQTIKNWSSKDKWTQDREQENEVFHPEDSANSVSRRLESALDRCR